MPEDYIEYLKTTSCLKSGRLPLFVPDGRLAQNQNIDEIETDLCTQLPSGYKLFVRSLGSGCWAEASITHPEDLYVFDEDVGEICGFIALAENVDGCGNFVAFNPKDQRHYYCSHDPFGYALVSATFEEFIKTIASVWLADSNNGSSKFYKSLTPFIEIEPFFAEASTEKKQWWQFWK